MWNMGTFNDMGYWQWVCVKMLCTHTPNGFADHYPYYMAISLGVYPIFRHTQMMWIMYTLVMTNTSPWYGWPIYSWVTWVNLLIAWWFSMANCECHNQRLLLRSFKMPIQPLALKVPSFCGFRFFLSGPEHQKTVPPTRCFCSEAAGGSDRRWSWNTFSPRQHLCDWFQPLQGELQQQRLHPRHWVKWEIGIAGLEELNASQQDMPCSPWSPKAPKGRMRFSWMIAEDIVDWVMGH